MITRQRRLRQSMMNNNVDRNVEKILNKAQQGLLEVWQPVVAPFMQFNDFNDLVAAQHNPMVHIYFLANHTSELNHDASMVDRLIHVDSVKLDESDTLTPYCLRDMVKQSAYQQDPTEQFFYKVFRFKKNGRIEESFIFLDWSPSTNVYQFTINPLTDNAIRVQQEGQLATSIINDPRVVYNPNIDNDVVNSSLGRLIRLMKPEPAFMCCFDEYGNEIVKIKSQSNQNPRDLDINQRLAIEIAYYLFNDRHNEILDLWLDIEYFALYYDGYVSCAKMPNHASSLLDVFAMNHRFKRFAHIPINVGDLWRYVIFDHIHDAALEASNNAPTTLSLLNLQQNTTQSVPVDKETAHQLTLMRFDDQSSEFNASLIRSMTKYFKDRSLLIVQNNTTIHRGYLLTHLFLIPRYWLKIAGSVCLMDVLGRNYLTDSDLEQWTMFVFDIDNQGFPIVNNVDEHFTDTSSSKIWSWYKSIGPKIIRLPNLHRLIVQQLMKICHSNQALKQLHPYQCLEISELPELEDVQAVRKSVFFKEIDPSAMGFDLSEMKPQQNRPIFVFSPIYPRYGYLFKKKQSWDPSYVQYYRAKDHHLKQISVSEEEIISLLQIISDYRRGMILAYDELSRYNSPLVHVRDALMMCLFEYGNKFLKP